MDRGSAKTACRHGVECTNFDDSHRAQFAHPEGIALACQYGSNCFRKNLKHLQQFVHPGDRNYRLGMVHFPTRKGVQVSPEFHTLRDLFNYCDPDESGNISREEFEAAWDLLSGLPADLFGNEEDNMLGLIGNVDQAWTEAAGQDHTHVTFAQFANWASNAKLNLPMGIDSTEGAHLLCRFQYAGGTRCPCANYSQGEQPNICECGHKSSVHLSDIAMMSLEEQEVLHQLKRRVIGGRGPTTLSRIAAPARKPGFTMVTKKAVLEDLQRQLTQSHKTHDNWTRDRGCSQHGRNACETSCIMRNRAPVPNGYELVRAERNRNAPLWQTYVTTRAAIKQECASSAVPFEEHRPLSSLEVAGEEELDLGINECRLFHGTSLAACQAICGSNFRLKLAGTGATWKDSRKDTGKPLYGYGVYLAENATKADEYAEPIVGGLPSDEGLCAMLVCRVAAGLCRVVDTNEFDTEELRTDVFDGPYHSVFGDRVVKLGKPFREIVVYDSVQVFPEFILYYKRLME